ncbi:hypothetical protein Tco_1476116 [Tanacetum coccineum]
MNFVTPRQGGNVRRKQEWISSQHMKVESLEADLKQTKQVYGAAYTKLIMKVKKLEKTVKTSHSRRRAKIVVSDDEEDSEDSSKHWRMIEEIDQDAGITLVTRIQGEDQPKDQLGVLSAAKDLADAAKINVHTYIRRRRAIIIGTAGGISTAGASMPVSTGTSGGISIVGASMPVSIAGMVQEVNISIPSPVVVKDKARVEADEELSKRPQAEERNKYSEVDQAKMLQLKRYSFDELNELFETTIKNVNTFVPMEIEDKGRASELATRSSQAIIIDSVEVSSSKRAAEAELDHEGSKRQNTNEASGSDQEQLEEEEKELSQEDLQQMMMVVPVEEVYVEALQDMLNIFDMDDLVMLWNLVKERFSSTEPTDDKERTL